MQQANLYQRYKAQSLETLTKGEIVVKLFEEASKQISVAIFFTNGGNNVKAYNCIAKAQKIIQTLNFSLDMKYAISIELNDMYIFLYNKLGEAAAARDVALMKDVLSLVDDLKVTFRQAEKLARANSIR
jgi:flagellar protein FliS